MPLDLQRPFLAAQAVARTEPGVQCGRARTRCAAKESNEDSFCICNGLLSSAGYNPDKEEPLFTVGTNASRVDRIVSVKTLMAELTGAVSGPSVKTTAKG